MFLFLKIKERQKPLHKADKIVGVISGRLRNAKLGSSYISEEAGCLINGFKVLLAILGIRLDRF